MFYILGRGAPNLDEKSFILAQNIASNIYERAKDALCFYETNRRL
ncbi:hypothetical protein CAMRE0001_2517 [Campylobacter rectus RM3267]|uniref:Uncharacterized protein n=1 Tax=Campylobacter rectus RM3267 TaxID=553218 RepID=B9D5F0_CAMRE|nr:hypothetical protein CAMRE0001_2517 [Campylobacter rectus RM3267]